MSAADLVNVHEEFVAIFALEAQCRLVVGPAEARLRQARCSEPLSELITLLQHSAELLSCESLPVVTCSNFLVCSDHSVFGGSELSTFRSFEMLGIRVSLTLFPDHDIGQIVRILIVLVMLFAL